MARKPTQTQRLRELIARLEPVLARAFREAMQDLRDGVDYSALVSALERNDVESAVAALNIESSVFNEFARAKTETYSAAGVAQTAYIPSPKDRRITFRFDMENPVAKQWISQNVGEMVAGLEVEQVRIVRSTILQGYGEGNSPITIARVLSGKVDKSTGRRTGGLIGLSEPQTRYVESMRRRLTSGKTSDLRKILGIREDGTPIPDSGMTRRNKRFDTIIRRHLKSGTKIPTADVARMTSSYSDRLLQRRAEDIARTETGQAVMASRIEAFRQSASKANVDERFISRKWRHGGGGKDPREQHQAMNNVVATGLTTPFTLPDGTTMMHPLDPNAPPHQVVNCTCDMEINIDYAARLRGG